MRAQLAEVLHPHVTVVEVSTRDEALASVDAEWFDAAFIDIDRTDQSGMNIAARLRRSSSQKRVRLIAVTSTNRSSDLAAFRDAGFDLRVAWPIKTDQVLAALHTIRLPHSNL